jgi:gliding motility-associated-like protein
LCSAVEHSEIYSPTAFTPDANGLNDVFLPYGKNWELVSIDIYNRWGEVLYKGNSGWNGIFQGAICPDGTYIFRARFKHTILDEELPKETEGTFHLIR